MAASDGKKIVVMPLGKALHILTSIHTRDDAQVGFVIEHGATCNPYTSPFSIEDYDQAWKSVRAHIHMQVEPPKEK